MFLSTCLGMDKIFIRLIDSEIILLIFSLFVHVHMRDCLENMSNFAMINCILKLVV